MSRYPLNLPAQLKQEAEALAAQQGVSLNQFVLWAVAEKVGALSNKLDDPAFPQITYRRGGSGIPAPVLRGTGIRVQTMVAATTNWGMSPAQIAEEYDIREHQVREAWRSTKSIAPRLMPTSPRRRPWSKLRQESMAKPRLHLDADISQKALQAALIARGHDVTRTPNEWMPLDASDETQLLAASHAGAAS